MIDKTEEEWQYFRDKINEAFLKGNIICTEIRALSKPAGRGTAERRVIIDVELVEQ